MPPQAPPQRNEVVEWFQSIPPITKAIFTLSVVTTVAPAFGLIEPYAIILSWERVAKFQLWRLVTSFFFNRLGLGFAMNLYFMYRYSIQLENEVFQGRTADYVYYYLVTGVLQLVAAKFLGLIVLSEGFLLSIAYIWAQNYREVPVSFMFGIQFRAKYLPWVLVGYEYLTSGVTPWSSLMGIASSHVYYYLTTVYPSQGGRRFLSTPTFLQRLFPPSMTPRQTGAFTAWPGRQQQQQQEPRAAGTTNLFGGHQWGRGQRLDN